MKWSHTLRTAGTRVNERFLPPAAVAETICFVLAASMVGLVCAASAWAGGRQTEKTTLSSPPAGKTPIPSASGGKTAASPAYVMPEDITLLDKVSGALTRVARVTKPSVVSIQTSTPKARGRIEHAFASGVIFDKSGHIITSCHVVEGATQLDVTLADGRKLRAALVGKDPKTDVGVIHVNAAGLTPAKFTDSSRVEVGQLVLAIGSPFALAQTVTHGIVSATGRTDVDIEGMEYQNFIQCDAPTNPGNSGGALINTHGEVIGINTAIATGSGQFSGIAFATPANTVVWAAKQIIGGRPLTRGYLGVGIAPVSSEVASRAGLDSTLGAVIERVTEGSPANKAGLRADDIVLQINGTKVGDNTQLMTLIAEQAPGEHTSITIWREGQQRKVEVLMGEQPRNH